MLQCESCGAELPDNAHFCGKCGQVSSDPSEWPTRVTGLPAVNPGTRDAATALSVSSTPPSLLNVDQVQENSVLSIPDLVTVSLNQEVEDDEEKRRRAAMLGFGLPFLGNQSFGGHAPMVQGTPQVPQVPLVQGIPQASQAPLSAAGHALGSPPSSAAMHLPQLSISPPISDPTTPLHLPHHSVPLHSGDSDHHHTLPHSHHPHHGRPRRHSRHWVAAAIIAPIIIIVTIIGAGFTVWAPVLSLSGGTDVVLGGTLHLHGRNFIPGSSVTLTLDGSIPLYYTYLHPPQRIGGGYGTNSAVAAGMLAGLVFSSSNTITTGGDGTFNASIPINLNWSLGRHTIRASESITQRSAELSFTIFLAGTLPQPAPSGTPSLSPTAHPKPSPSPTRPPSHKGSPHPTASPTPIPSASPTPTTPPAGSPTPTPPPAELSCVDPSSITLGPVSEDYAQPVSTTVTLCTTGSGTVNWKATWNTNSASWLQLNQSSGQIQAPDKQQVNVSALASQLSPGNYTATVIFSGQPGNSTVALNVSFTVQAGCINATPQSLNFTGIAGMSDPSAQSVTISNCGAVGTWSEATQTDSGGNWLSASPTGGTLDAGSTSYVSVTASNLNANLPPGTYTGKLLFALGSGSATVMVTLTVQAPPTLSVSPNSIYANQQCSSYLANDWSCNVSLINNSNNLSLNWSASSTGIPGITFKPASDTIGPGQSESVEITLPYNDCQTSTTLIFTGPVNTVNVPWTCTVIG